MPCASLCSRITVSVLMAMQAISTASAQDDLRKRADVVLFLACRHYHGQVATNGGYVYYYSPDLQQRSGEGPASSTQIWVQPPGTPTVGLAYLSAYDATGHPFYLQAAMDAGNALLYGRLQSGGWTNSIDFDPNGKTAAYRNGKGKGRNFSSLDDGITQTTLQFLVKLDQASGFRNRSLHQETKSALEALLKSQFTNGGFPQGWDEDVQSNRPSRQASFPDYDWRTDGRIKNYWDMATLNDGMAGTITATLLTAHDVYERDLPAQQQTYLPALKRFGDFLIAAQLPEPQRGWAQQYSDDMHPIWARRFEPPAVAGRESQDVIEALIRIFNATGDERYLQPVPSALNWLEQSELTDGRLARYYELQTNRPLYMSRSGKQYSLTYDDSRLPNHYGWKVQNHIAELRRRYQNATAGKTEGTSTAKTEDAIKAIVDSMDHTGRWISEYSGEALTGQPKFRDGERYLSSQVFADNVTALAQFIKKSEQP